MAPTKPVHLNASFFKSCTLGTVRRAPRLGRNQAMANRDGTMFLRFFILLRCWCRWNPKNCLKSCQVNVTHIFACTIAMPFQIFQLQRRRDSSRCHRRTFSEGHVGRHLLDLLWMGIVVLSAKSTTKTKRFVCRSSHQPTSVVSSESLGAPIFATLTVSWKEKNAQKNQLLSLAILVGAFLAPSFTEQDPFAFVAILLSRFLLGEYKKQIYPVNTHGTEDGDG